MDMPVVVSRYVAKLVIFRLCAYQCMSHPFSGGRMTVWMIEYKWLFTPALTESGLTLAPVWLWRSSLETAVHRPMKNPTTGRHRTLYTWGLGVRTKASLAGSLAWKHNDAEDADAADVGAGGDMPTISTRVEPRPNCLWTSPGEGGRVNCKISRDRRFQPPNTVPKKEELQLAEASFRDNQPQISVDSPIYWWLFMLIHMRRFV